MALFEKKEDIFRLMEKFEKSSITELELEAGENIKIKLSRNAGNVNSAIQTHSMKTAVSSVLTSAANESESESVQADNLDVIEAPIIGTFYSTPSPDSEPYVKVGDKVKKGEILCILEAMKVMNEIECEQDCEIAEILVSNGTLVEYGQPLFKIK